MSNSIKELNILLVEDDSLDVIGIERALLKLKISNRLFVKKDGIEALEFLRSQPNEFEFLTPCVILLDINMPRMNGIEFLHELRKDLKFRDVSVFILTGSSEDDNIYQAYKQHVAGYIIKSDPVESLKNAFQLMDCSYEFDG